MTAFGDWRRIIAESLGGYYATEGIPIDVHPFPAGKVDLPAMLIEPGGTADYLTLEVEGSETATACRQWTAEWRVWAFLGIPGDRATYDLIDLVLPRLPAAVASIGVHADNTAGLAPEMVAVPAPEKIEHDGQAYIGIWFDLSLDINLKGT